MSNGPAPWSVGIVNLAALVTMAHDGAAGGRRDRSAAVNNIIVFIGCVVWHLPSAFLCRSAELDAADPAESAAAGRSADGSADVAGTDRRGDGRNTSRYGIGGLITRAATIFAYVGLEAVRRRRNRKMGATFRSAS